MLLVSAILLGTSTFAWFSMNTQVTATGMQVQAKAEDGIVISNAPTGTYDVSAASVKDAVSQLYPGSTSDLNTWVHSKSTNPASANTQQVYEPGTAWTANSGTYGNYVVHDFYIRSSAASTLTIASLDIKSVDITSTSQNLSKALRVGIKFEGSVNKYIYAPVTGYSNPVSVQTTTGAYSTEDRVSVSALAADTESKDTSITSLPANTAAGTHVYIYIWYEGEDAACISNNIQASLDQITVSVNFGFTAAA
jgi:hypothetical protein